MIAAAFLVAIQAASAAPLPPADWHALPPLRYLRTAEPGPDLSAFVRAEVRSGRCARAVATPGGWMLTVELAVLATPQALVRRVVPRAIDCPAVEQYAAGLVSSRVRGNLDVSGAQQDGWYRTALTFSWPA